MSNYLLLFQKSELSSKETECFKEDATDMPHVGSIKLFGRTFSMGDNQKSQDLDGENSKSTSCKSDQGDVVDIQLSLGICNNTNLNATPEEAQMKCSKYLKENPCFVKPAPDETLSWWNMYQNLPVFHLNPCNQILYPTPIRPSLKDRMTEKESSCTGSNAEPVCEIVNGDRNSEADDSQSQSSHHEAGIVPHKNSLRGFVPYKRCLAERDANSAIVALEEREGQRARVCS